MMIAVLDWGRGFRIYCWCNRPRPAIWSWVLLDLGTSRLVVLEKSSRCRWLQCRCSRLVSSAINIYKSQIQTMASFWLLIIYLIFGWLWVWCISIIFKTSEWRGVHLLIRICLHSPSYSTRHCRSRVLIIFRANCCLCRSRRKILKS